MAALQSKVGLERAQELQAYTTAMLQYAKAKSEMNDQQISWTEAQLDALRLHIEALNTTVKAATVDAHMHGDRLAHHATMTGHAVQHAANLSDTAARARELANEQPGPADIGGGGGDATPIQQPASSGDGGAGLPGMETPPNNSMLPAIPGAPQSGS
jgi:hypothetical protein